MPSDQRKRVETNRAVARIGWRPCRLNLYHRLVQYTSIVATSLGSIIRMTELKMHKIRQIPPCRLAYFLVAIAIHSPPQKNHSCGIKRIECMKLHVGLCGFWSHAWNPYDLFLRKNRFLGKHSTTRKDIPIVTMLRGWQAVASHFLIICTDWGVC
jgi:hypothetical protein